MTKTFAFHLYPSKSQRARREAVRETCRHFSNDCLRGRKDVDERRGDYPNRPAPFGQDREDDQPVRTIAV